MKYPQALEDLIECFTHLPSVGKKSAERFALYCLMQMDEAELIDFSNALIGITKDISTFRTNMNILGNPD